MLLPSPSIRLLNRAQLTRHFIYLFCVRSDEYKHETPFFPRSSSSSMFMWVVMEPFEKSLAQGLPHDVAEGFFFTNVIQSKCRIIDETAAAAPLTYTHCP